MPSLYISDANRRQNFGRDPQSRGRDPAQSVPIFIFELDIISKKKSKHDGKFELPGVWMIHWNPQVGDSSNPRPNGRYLPEFHPRLRRLQLGAFELTKDLYGVIQLSLSLISLYQEITHRIIPKVLTSLICHASWCPIWLHSAGHANVDFSKGISYRFNSCSKL